jgi:hypothetical protein
MRAFHTLGVALGAAVVAASAQAAGLVQVKFIQPEKFADVRDASLRMDDNLKTLQRVIEQVGAGYVADGQTLRIEVLDVDLAGEVKPSRRLQDIRVMRGRADWPRIELRYTLESPGAAVRTGQARIADMSYLHRLPPAAGADDALPYERRMLDEWFRTEFKPH